MLKSRGKLLDHRRWAGYSFALLCLPKLRGVTSWNWFISVGIHWQRADIQIALRALHEHEPRAGCYPRGSLIVPWH
jgi:hypothetical protein